MSFRSSKDVHDMLDNIAKLRLTTCPACREEVQYGLTNSQQDRNPQDEKQKTDEVFSAYNANNDQKVCFLGHLFLYRFKF